MMIRAQAWTGAPSGPQGHQQCEGKKLLENIRPAAGCSPLEQITDTVFENMDLGTHNATIYDCMESEHSCCSCCSVYNFHVISL